jgi:hypothetical protein
MNLKGKRIAILVENLELEKHLELANRVCDGVGPDREVDDEGAQDQFRVAEFSHPGV